MVKEIENIAEFKCVECNTVFFINSKKTKFEKIKEKIQCPVCPNVFETPFSEFGSLDNFLLEIECPNTDCKRDFIIKVINSKPVTSLNCPYCKGSIGLKAIN